MPPSDVPAATAGRVGIFSRGIARIPHLPAFLGAEPVFSPSGPEGLCAIAGWGAKPTAAKARALAQAWGLPYLALEDGFYRSLDLGARGAAPLSLVLDPVGVYYDATRPSLLEDLLEGRAAGMQALENPALLAEARALMARIRAEGLSKYNHAPDLPPDALPQVPGGRVLVADQTRDDASVRLCGAEPQVFATMLGAALDENPGAQVWVKPHPDVLAGKKQGCLPAPLPAGVRLLPGDASPHSVLRQVDKVYTVSSQLGFEALLLGLPVRCFGLPFYAGWGATQDALSCPRRTRRRTPDEIFAAACLLYARYVDPHSGQPCGLARVLEVLSLCRERDRANAGRTVCLGFQRWKRPYARAYLGSTRGEVRFAADAAEAVRLAAEAGRSDGLGGLGGLGGPVPSGASGEPDRTGGTGGLGGRVVVWASSEPAELAHAARAAGVPLLRMEDGFLRSVGLGSDFVRPYSLVLDPLGVYYDAGRESALERLLNRGGFEPELLARAASLRRELLARGLTKYNQGGPVPDFSAARQRRILLVPGQVADDASVRLGGAGIAGNLELLRAVRAARPEAFLAYKPHPDVLAGNRKGAVPKAALAELCDAVLADVSMGALLPLVHEVHTLTSLTGFEALLRGLPVHTYGTPFYAGWGLTTDRAAFPGRTRRAGLDELIAATLLLYPLYFDWDAGLPCRAEDVVLRLGATAGTNSASISNKRLRHWGEYLMRTVTGR